MNLNAPRTFLSEANLKEHLAYFRTLKNKYSIIEKSIPELKGKQYGEILKMNLNRQIKAEALDLLCRIRAHEIYFSSFSEDVKPSALIRKYYGSENNFLYEMKKAALLAEYGYVYVYTDHRARPCFRCVQTADERIFKDHPKLLVDLFEHAYFADYGFNYPLYIDGAFSHLDLSLIS